MTPSMGNRHSLLATLKSIAKNETFLLFPFNKQWQSFRFKGFAFHLIGDDEPHAPTPSESECLPHEWVPRGCSHLVGSYLDVSHNATLASVHESDTHLHESTSAL